MALAATLFAHDERRGAAPVLRTLPSGWRNNPSDPQTVTYEGKPGTITVRYSLGSAGPRATFDQSDPVAFVYDVVDDAVHLELAGRRRTYRVTRTEAVFDVDGPAGHLRLVERARFPSAANAADAGSLHAPMPGKVLSVRVTAGDAVTAGDDLLVMEAMKMEHTLRAPVSGTVEAVHAAVGDQVEAEAALVVIREESDA